MASCEWQRELNDWALDELAPEKRTQLEEHIGRCEECARSAQRLRKLRQALMSSLTDQEMPAHLVFAPGDDNRRIFVHFWASLARTAALSAAAACIFLAILSLGFARWKGQLVPGKAERQTALTAGQIQALVSRAVAEQAALQVKQTAASDEDLASSLRQEQARDLAQLTQRLAYLELAQNAVWKQTQQQSEVVSLIARDYLRPGTASPADSPQR